MAKFELKLYDSKTGEIEKTYTRAFVPVGLYIRYQKIAEDAGKNKYKSDEEFFIAIKDLFLETFPELTEEEYLTKTDVAEVLLLWTSIINKSTELADEESKKA